MVMQVKLVGSKSHADELLWNERAYVYESVPFPIPNVKRRNLNEIRYEIEQFQFSGRKLVPE